MKDHEERRRGIARYSVLAVQPTPESPIIGDCLISAYVPKEFSCKLRKLHLPFNWGGSIMEFDRIRSYENVRYLSFDFPHKREGEPFQGKRQSFFEEILRRLEPELKDQLKRACPLEEGVDERGRSAVSYCKILYDQDICDKLTQKGAKGWKVRGKITFEV